MSAAWGNMRSWHADVVVIGGGPAGQKAAVQARKAGKSTVVIDEDPGIGGACVRRGTIPSKTLRETALVFSRLADKSGGVLPPTLAADTQLEGLMARKDDVIAAHEQYMRAQLERNGIELVHGRARFISEHEIEIRTPRGVKSRVRADIIVIATGSRPRSPPQVPVDHERVFDSDSILSMVYLPQSLCVLGAGVIASEYASVFAALGVKVNIVDKGARPVAFLEPELVDGFLQAFTQQGGRFLGKHNVDSVCATDAGGVAVTVSAADGQQETLEVDKVLCCLGRVANVEHLDLGAAGLSVNARGLLDVDAHLRTAVPHIYAVGDVIGPPALASTSMEQGRRAMRHALGIVDDNPHASLVPVGVYTIPEMASVGASEAEAIKAHGAVAVGRARFHEIARGHIAGQPNGMLKLVATADGKRLLGVHVVGESAAELVHVGLMAVVGNLPVSAFVEHTLNFPTLAEAYRVAALDLLSRIQVSGDQETWVEGVPV